MCYCFIDDGPSAVFLNFQDFNFKDILQETVKNVEIFYFRYVVARPYLKPGAPNRAVLLKYSWRLNQPSTCLYPSPRARPPHY